MGKLLRKIPSLSTNAHIQQSTQVIFRSIIVLVHSAGSITDLEMICAAYQYMLISLSDGSYLLIWQESQ